MKLTKRGEYGLKALIDLAAQDDPQAATQIKDIAQRQQIPVKFLEQILLTLKNAGVLRSRA
ncbi:MAG TPA: Rrf2 family transcriptional regulator, partial [Anaerolineae bacterium]|nr:Rrf2 family transcriptional regulator [Anaerolineae bacterium]